MKKIVSLCLAFIICLSILPFANADSLFGFGKKDKSKNERNPTPFDKLVERPSMKETISELGTPDSSGKAGNGSQIIYFDYEAYDCKENTALFIVFDLYGSLDCAKWDVFKNAKYNKDLNIEETVIKIRDSLTENFGDYTREDGVYIWYDIIGNSYALTTAKEEIALFFNNPSLAKNYGK